MNTLIAITVGVLAAASIYSLLRCSMMKLIVGIVLLGHAVNLLIFSAGGLRDSTPPIIAENQEVLRPPHADPLPQALVLTAIVISFGLIAFCITLVQRTYDIVGDDDINALARSDS